jgi:hypothetical protein
MTGLKYDDLPKSTRRRMILRAEVRPALIIIGLLLMYYLMPLWDRHTRSTGVSLVLGLALVVVVLAWQIRKISTSRYPRLRAIEALSFSSPLHTRVRHCLLRDWAGQPSLVLAGAEPHRRPVFCGHDFFLRRVR